MKSTRHLGIDGYRGVGVYMLIMVHSIPGFLVLDQWDLWVARIFNLGGMAIDMFFTSSGFLITTILVQTKGRKGYFNKFYIRRFLRIFPAYYVFLAIIFSLPIYIYGQNTMEMIEHSNNKIWFFTYLQNLYFLYGTFFRHSYLDHTWTLALEEQFYLLFPIFVYFLNKKNLTRTIYLLLVVTVLMRWYLIEQERSYIWTGFHPLVHMNVILIGAHLAIHRDAYLKLQTKTVFAIFIACLTIAIFTLGIGLGQSSVNSTPSWITLFSEVTVAIFNNMIIVLILQGHKWTNKILTIPPLTFAGKYGYSFYLYHYPICFYLYKEARLYDLLRNHIPNALTLPVFSIIALIISMIFAIISWHCLEVWFLKLKALPFAKYKKEVQL